MSSASSRRDSSACPGFSALRTISCSLDGDQVVYIMLFSAARSFRMSARPRLFTSVWAAANFMSSTQHLAGRRLAHSTVQYSTVQYSTVQYSTVQHSTAQYSTVQALGIGNLMPSPRNAFSMPISMPRKTITKLFRESRNKHECCRVEQDF